MTTKKKSPKAKRKTAKRKPPQRAAQTTLDTAHDGPGRPKADIDINVVKALAGVGCTVEEIADHFDVDKKTLERRFMDIINKGRMSRNRSLRRKQAAMAFAGDRTMAIWLGKQWLGQSDKTQLTGKDDGPLRVQHEVKQLTDAEIDAAIAEILGPVARGPGETDGADSGASAAA